MIDPRLLKSLLLASLLVFVAACDDDDDDDDDAPANTAPSAAATASPNPAQGGDTVTVDASASSDADGDALTFSWTAPAEITLSSTTATAPTFAAPDVDADTEFSFSVEVSDGELTDTASVTVTVEAAEPVNQAPSAAAGASPATVTEGDTVTLSAAASSDPDGDPLTFAWTAPAEVTLSDATAEAPTFTAPEVDADTEFSFSVEVSDGELTDTASVTVTVEDSAAANQAPSADATATPNPATEGATVTLSAAGSSDPDGDPLTFVWTAPAEVTLSDATAEAPTFTAPEVEGNTDFIFEVEASDGELTDTASVTVTVEVDDVVGGCEGPFLMEGDGANECVIMGMGPDNPVTGTLNLTSDFEYTLDGALFIGQDVGGGAEPNPGAATGTLNIEAGVTITSAGGDGQDLIVISRGSQIFANGTAAEPIILTGAEQAGAGEWGGLVINGRAPSNRCSDPSGLDCAIAGEGNSGDYGGPDPADDSGLLRYVSVRYAGNLISDINELNGIAFQAVGNGTEVEFIHVHRNADDGVEFFGGTVNAKYIALTGNQDDSLDWTDGWTGNVQYVVVRQTLNDAGTIVGDQGIEADNRSTDTTLEPFSQPVIANMTLVGLPDVQGLPEDDSDEGIRLRAGTGANLFSTIVANFGDECLNIDDATTFERAVVEGFDGTLDSVDELSGTLTIESSRVFGCAGGAFDDSDGDLFAVSDWFNVQAGNSTDPVELVEAVFPAETVTGGTVPADPFFDQVSFIGAFEDVGDRWIDGWTIGFETETAGCPTGTTELEAGLCEISGFGPDSPVIGNFRLTAGNDYLLNGPLFVGEDVGGGADPLADAQTGALQIDAGVTVRSAQTDGEDFIVISRGSKIFANGTQAQPIILTGAEEQVSAEWGGLVINGRAPSNRCGDPSGLDCGIAGEGNSGDYGGPDPSDDSGVLSWVSVRYAGDLISDINELNGIAFQGVGNGTDVNFIHVHGNADDGVEFFGGTVNAKYIALSGNQDDSLDWTDGWTGNVQFVVVQHLLNTAGTIIGDQGIEADNRSTDPILEPFSQPAIANGTFVGIPDVDLPEDDSDIGVLLRAGTGANLFNFLIANFGNECLDIDDATTFERAVVEGFDGTLDSVDELTGVLTMQGSRLSTCTEGNFSESDGDLFSVGDWFNVQASNSTTPVILNGVFPTEEISGGVLPPNPNDGSGFTFDPVDYVGAFADENDRWIDPLVDGCFESFDCQ